MRDILFSKLVCSAMQRIRFALINKMEELKYDIEIVRDANVVLECTLSFFIILEFSSMSLCLHIFNDLSADNITTVP
jgi:hypothetical protein